MELETVYIIGNYEFLGFHFCEKILEDGIEVVGVHLISNKDEYLIEEKRLQVGRNANFTECLIQQLDLENINSSKKIWFVDFYDLFMNEREQEVLENENLKKVFEKLDMNTNKIVFLLPISLLVHSVFTEEKKKLQKLVDSIALPVQEIYLPTIYGPWQPKEFLFHQALCDDNDSWNYSKREWTGDAIYVEDMVTEILRITEERNDKYLLLSNDNEQWKRVAASLKLTHEPIDGRTINFDGVKRFVVPSITIEEGLNKQKRKIRSLRLEE